MKSRQSTPVANRNGLRTIVGCRLFAPPHGGTTMTVSEFARTRPATERSNKLRFLTPLTNLITTVGSWLGRLVSFAFARILMIFVIGFAAGIAWQSYGGGARKAIAGWSPHLAWVAPAATPAGSSAERLR